ncbi:hypothetical protein RB195_012339 [Necator americanus]|uniref:Uncharacterized protein n=1 Tax=Necator americanus TaxID=51031 RepID=A0ABR1D7F5_NECAM
MSRNHSAPAVCAEPAATNHTYSQRAYGDLAPFYNYTATLMRFIVKDVDDATITRVARMINDPKETSIFILGDVFRNGYILLVVVASLLISAILLISCLLAFTCNFFGGDKRMPSKRTITCAMLSFVFCLFMACVGAYLFTNSVMYIRSALTILPVQLNKSSEDIRNFVAEFATNLRCNFDEGEKLLRYEIDQFIAGITSILYSLRWRINPQPVIKVFEIEEEIRSDLNFMNGLMKTNNIPLYDLKFLSNATNDLLKTLTVGMESIRDALNDTRDRLVLLGKDLNTSIGQMNQQKSTMLSELSVYEMTLEAIVNAVNQQSEESRKVLYRILQEHDYVEKSNKYIIVILVLPLTLVLLSALGLAFLFFRCLGNIFSNESDQEFPIRNMISDLGARILSLGGYLALLVTSLLFLMVAACFVIAFISMFLCMGLFEDHDVRLLYALPPRSFKSNFSKNNNIKLNMHDTFYKCKNGFSFFDAIEGDKIWARKEVGKKLSDLRKTSFRRRLRNFHLSSEIAENLKKTASKINESSQNFNSSFQQLRRFQDPSIHTFYVEQLEKSAGKVLNNTVRLNTALVECGELVTDLASRSRRDRFSVDIQTHLKRVEEAIIEAVAKLLRTMNDLSPQCQSLMAIWNDIGFYLCNIIAVPAQGLWVACLLTAIGSFTIYTALFEATTFLFSYAKEKAESMESEGIFRQKKSSLAVDKTQYDEWEKSKKVSTQQELVIPGIDAESAVIMTPLPPNRHSRKVKWIPVDSVLYHLFGIPQGVKFMPVLRSSRDILKRAPWSQRGLNMADGSWRTVDERKTGPAPSVTSTTTKDKSTKLENPKRYPIEDNLEANVEIPEMISYQKVVPGSHRNIDAESEQKIDVKFEQKTDEGNGESVTPHMERVARPKRVDKAARKQKSKSTTVKPKIRDKPPQTTKKPHRPASASPRLQKEAKHEIRSEDSEKSLKTAIKSVTDPTKTAPVQEELGVTSSLTDIRKILLDEKGAGVENGTSTDPSKRTAKRKKSTPPSKSTSKSKFKEETEVEKKIDEEPASRTHNGSRKVTKIKEDVPVDDINRPEEETKEDPATGDPQKNNDENKHCHKHHRES